MSEIEGIEGWEVPGQPSLFEEEMTVTETPHAPTRVTGTAHTKGGQVTFDYVGCTVCRIDHPIVGRTPQPFHKAHPDGLPSTATQIVRDGTSARR